MLRTHREIYYVNFDGYYNVTRAVFHADGTVLCRRDYSVAGFTVPDGGVTMLLLGATMIGLRSLNRRFSK